MTQKRSFSLFDIALFVIMLFIVLIALPQINTAEQQEMRDLDAPGW